MKWLTLAAFALNVIGAVSNLTVFSLTGNPTPLILGLFNGAVAAWLYPMIKGGEMIIPGADYTLSCEADGDVEVFAIRCGRAFGRHGAEAMSWDAETGRFFKGGGTSPWDLKPVPVPDFGGGI